MESKNIYEKLNDFQKEELHLLKTKSAHQYKYSPLDDIMEAVTPLLQKHGLIVSHSNVVKSNHITGEHIEYVVTHLCCINNPKTEYISSETKIQYGIKIGSMNPVMVIGAQITYIRRYHVVTLLGLTTEEDTDTNPTSSAKGDVAKVLKEGPDYVKIFTNQIATGKDPKTLMKSLDNYKAKMTEEVFKMVSHLLDEAINKTKK